MEGVILLSVWALFYQLLQQQGRILLRLDSLEQTSVGGRLVGQEKGELRAIGLSVGTPVPPLLLRDLMGQMLASEGPQGKRTLLILWSRGCSFCEDIAKDVALLQDAFAQQNVELVLITYGDAKTNGEQAKKVGLKCRILLWVEEREEPTIFKDVESPAAYLLDEQGRVAQPLAVGSGQVLALARAVAAGAVRKRLPGERALTASRIERDGLKAGTAAPRFRLPDLRGRPVSLEDYRGRKVLLVFTDPHCGPCDVVASQLARLYREHQSNGLEILMVGRGDAQENRRKAERHGADFPVVLQKSWELSKKYEIFTTPAGFLINEEGFIEREVACGPEAILYLAHSGAAERNASCIEKEG
jgi:peroxiredoxin